MSQPISKRPPISGVSTLCFKNTAMPPKLESDIEIAWERAKGLRIQASADPNEIAALISDLRSCATRAKALGLPGEQELLWLVERLEWLTGESRKPTYTLV